MEKVHSGIITDPDRICNLDETHVDGELGKREKSFCDSRSHTGSFTGVAKGSGKHLTTILFISASAPMSCIAASKLVMKRWLDLLLGSCFKDNNGEPQTTFCDALKRLC